jgi:hypothetical protein
VPVFRGPGSRSPMSLPALSEITRGSQVPLRDAVPADAPQVTVMPAGTAGGLPEVMGCYL